MKPYILIICLSVVIAGVLVLLTPSSPFSIQCIHEGEYLPGFDNKKCCFGLTEKKTLPPEGEPKQPFSKCQK